MTQNNPSPSIEERAKDYADSKFPNPNPVDAPYATTGDRWDDISDAYKAGFIAGSSTLQSDKGSDADGWISVEEKLPDDGQMVLAYGKRGRILHTSWEKYTDQDDVWFVNRFTHWMPNVPKPPIN